MLENLTPSTPEPDKTESITDDEQSVVVSDPDCWKEHVGVPETGRETDPACTAGTATASGTITSAVVRAVCIISRLARST